MSFEQLDDFDTGSEPTIDSPPETIADEEDMTSETTETSSNSSKPPTIMVEEDQLTGIAVPCPPAWLWGLMSACDTVFGLPLALANLLTQWSSKMTGFQDHLIETVVDGGWLPHYVIRKGIQREFRRRAREISSPTFEAAFARKMAFVEELRQSGIAIHTDAANRQHYEVVTGVMAAALGPRMKYSCCLFDTGAETLAQAEEEMLARYVEKMAFEDGMSLLDIGCGWGAAVLYFAERFPGSKIVGFSNSVTQRQYILEKVEEKGLKNLEVITGDAVTEELGENQYDRILSCEMFEHLKNYDGIMAKVERALTPGGQFLLHIFCHRDTPYHFADGWMAQNFFTGGTMPSADLLLYFLPANIRVAKHWWIHGRNYNRTIEGWLANFVANKERVWPFLEEMYGKEHAAVWFNRWQVYFLACAEMFLSGAGDTYGVTHYLFEKEKC